MTVAVYMQINRFFPSEIIQRTAIQKWLAQNKTAQSSVQWFIDREDKSEFQQMSDDIEHGAVEMVVMYSLEQAFPSIDSIKDAFALLAAKNTAFAVVSQGMFFEARSIKSVQLLLSVVSELAWHHYKVRHAKGVAEGQAKGRYKGRKPGSLKPGVDLKKVLRLHERGYKAERIAKRVGVTVCTIYRYIRVYSKK